MLKAGPAPGDGGLPDAVCRTDRGGGDEPRMAERILELLFGVTARIVVVVGTEGDAGTARLLEDPLADGRGDVARV